MTTMAWHAMSELLTRPFQRGAETLALSIGNDVGNWTEIKAYDFAEYRARYGAEPEAPHYLMFPRRSISGDGVTLEVEYTDTGSTATESVRIKIPPGSLSGATYAIPRPSHVGAQWRVNRFRVIAGESPGAVGDDWGVVALLGNLAKLNWILGREKDDIHDNLEDVVRQRSLLAAHDISLDLIGEDLRVPRFPARENSYDDGTIALYHFEEEIADPVKVIDAVAPHRPVAHDGVSNKPIRQAAGVFSYGYRFPAEDGSPAAVEIPHAAVFNIGAGASFTVELFLKVETVPTSPMIVIAKGSLDAEGGLADGGWAISAGGYRGFEVNLRFEVKSGSEHVKLYLDRNLPTDRFHHIAGVVDRTGRRLRLLVDGTEAVSGDIASFGAISNTSNIYIGSHTNSFPFMGVIDELRLSSIARLDNFQVLGEGDESYRRRLAVFEKWMLPEPNSLQVAVNEQVSINGNPEAFELVETDLRIAKADRLLRIFPAQLPAGQSMDSEGNQRSDEANVCGTAADDKAFREVFLFDHNAANVTYASDPNARRMAYPCATALSALVELVQGEAGDLHVLRAYDTNGRGLHSVGRAVELAHDNLALEQLAVRSLQAGFDYVENLGSTVYASCAPGETLDIAIEYDAGGRPTDGSDLHVGKQAKLKLMPEGLPRSGEIEWSMIHCEYGRLAAAGARNQSSIEVKAESPGLTTVRAAFRYDKQTVTGFRQLRIGLDSLGAGETIARTGQRGVDEETAIGSSEYYFHERFLTDYAGSVAFGPDPNTRKMQVGLGGYLDRLVGLLTGDPSHLHIEKAYDPAGDGSHKYGRAVVLKHDDLTAGELGALAHASEFGFVKVTGGTVYASVPAEELVSIIDSTTGQPIDNKVFVGQTVKLEVAPATLPDTKDYIWNIDTIGFGDALLSSRIRRQTELTPTEPGLAGLSAAYLEPDADRTFPYTFDIRLKPELDRPDTFISKHDYDVIMNILNYFHPIGIEVTTHNIRRHVIELKDNPLGASPEYTYPRFRDAERSIVVSKIIRNIRSDQNGS